MTPQQKTVYVEDPGNIRVGKELIGWDAKSEELVVTTPVVYAERVDERHTRVRTEYGGEYCASSEKWR